MTLRNLRDNLFNLEFDYYNGDSDELMATGAQMIATMRREADGSLAAMPRVPLAISSRSRQYTKAAGGAAFRDRLTCDGLT
jgi:hypothetical protein